MRICIDLDQTLCIGYPYHDAVPIPGSADFLKKLKQDGHTVIIHTARGMGRNSGDAGKAVRDIGLVTLKQLDEWEFVFDEIYFGKPAADMYIDDKAVLAVSYSQLEKQIEVAHAISERFNDPRWDQLQCGIKDLTNG